MAKDELDLVDLPDAPPPPALTLTGRLQNGTMIDVHFEPPNPEFFKTAKPGDVLGLTIRDVYEHITRQRKPAGSTPQKRKR